MRDADELTKLADEWKKRADDMGSNDPVSRAHIMVLRNCSRELRQLAERADHVPDTGNKVTAPEVSPPHDRCPKCTAKFPAGMTCGGEFCGLKRCFHPGCGTPTQPSACDFAQCPRK